MMSFEFCFFGDSVLIRVLGFGGDDLEGMAEVKREEPCLENKQSAASSSCSISEGSGSVTLKSPRICSPTATSPSHRYCSLTSLLLFFYFR